MRTFSSQPYRRESAADHASVDDRRCETGSNIQREKRQGTPASAVRLITSTGITAIAPAHAAGDVDVVVANPDGRSSGLTLRCRYTPDDSDDCAGCWDY